MNFAYDNIKEILAAKGPIRGSRYFLNKERRVIVPRINYFDNTAEGTAKDGLELHLFHTNTTYIGSIYDIKTWTVDNIQDPQTVYFDLVNDIKAFNLSIGSYKFVYNFTRKLVCSRGSATKLFVAEISRNRQEIVLALTNPNDGLEQSNIANFVLTYLQPKKYLPTTIVNFGQNRILDVINVTSDGSLNYLYVKLFSPLPSYLDIRSECWLETQILKPYIDNLEIKDTSVTTQFTGNNLRGPNFTVNASYNMTTDTELKSWTDILSENVNTSQEILNKYIYGDTKSVRLNIDFTKFQNFIFYSSAKERLENFFYKMELIETYNSQLTDLQSVAGGVDLETNQISILKLKDKLISGFDEWEKWMYYEEYTTNYGVINPYPKYQKYDLYDIATKAGTFKLYETTSPEVQIWYTDLLELAETFDSNNRDSLKNTLPEHITVDSQNEQFISFVNMIGQHFDVVYTYINHILKKNVRDENPKNELSQDLVQAVTNSFGWKLSSNTQDKDLWEYALGTDDNLIEQTNILGSKYNKTEEERTKEVWRRILNNLPYIQKTKGTSRGIRALLAAYGIPQTLLTIREYGGYYNPNSLNLGKNTYDKSTYYLNFSGSNSQYISIPWEKVYYEDNWVYPDTVTFRWRMNPEKFYNYSGIENEVVLQKNFGSRVDWFVTVNKNGTDIEKGSLTFWLGDGTTYLTASFYDEYLYDDVPLNIMIRRKYTDDLLTGNQVYDFILKTEKYGKLSIERSASIQVNGPANPNYNRAWSSDGELVIGHGTNIETNKNLFGAVYELRYWSNQLSEKSFNNHVHAPRAYNGNNPSSSFYDLQAQFKFWELMDLEVTNSINSVHPNQKQNNFYTSPKIAYLNGFNSSSFESINEVYLMEVANLGVSSDFSEKIRIDSASLAGALNPHASYENSSLNVQSIDSNRLMVAFSPQSIINEDIFESIGHVDLSEYIGDYSTIDDEEYFRLNQFSNEYWKKYENKNDFNAYINLIAKFDFSVFEQIAQTLPARANELLGLVIEPNILERVKTLPVKKLSGKTDGFVKETNALNKNPNLIPNYNSKNTVLFIGFEEGDALEVNMIDSDNEIVTEVNSETDEIIKDGEINANPKVPAKVITKKIRLDFGVQDITKLQYRSYTGSIDTELTKNNINMKSVSYDAPLSIDPLKNLKATQLNINALSPIYTYFYNNHNPIYSNNLSSNQIASYEVDNYYRDIIKYSNVNYVEDIEYSFVTSSIFPSPNSFNSAKKNREFFGCNDYPLPQKRVVQLNTTFYNSNSNRLDYSKILENYEDVDYEHNDVLYLKYAFSGSSDFGYFPSSSYWKTYIRGNYLTGSAAEENAMFRNVYGMIDTAPRILKINTAAPYVKQRKNLFSPKYLQEGKVANKNEYVNYPVSANNIRSFPWVLWWSGSNDSIPNLGPDFGFTSKQNILNSVTVTDSNTPTYQKI
jgi:hypothetical protein